MRILLINPQYKEKYIHSARWDGLTISGSHWYPIFLAYTTGLLEKQGHECFLLDAEADNVSDEKVLMSAVWLKPDFTIIYTSLRGLKENIILSRKINLRTESNIIFVGPWCSMPQVQKFVKEEIAVDHLVDGEFEYAVSDIIKGKVSDKIIKAKRLTKSQLNKLPWVTKVYDKHLAIKNYQIGSLWHPFVDVFTGRKCYWGKCSFCLWVNTIFKDGKYVARDINDVLDELEWVANNMHVKEIFIQDDTPPAWRCLELAVGIIERGINIKWSAYARGDLSLTPAILKKMKQSGCHCLHVGYESGSDEILKNINKGVTTKDLETFTKWCNDVDIDIHADFMVGLPGETEETIKQTIKWAKSLKVKTYQFAPPKPYPCTPFHSWLDNKKFFDKKGNPNYPGMSYEDMVDWCKKAMRECYFNFGYIRRIMFDIDEIKRLIRSGIYVLPHILSKEERGVEVD